MVNTIYLLPNESFYDSNYEYVDVGVNVTFWTISLS